MPAFSMSKILRAIRKFGGKQEDEEATSGVSEGGWSSLPHPLLSDVSQRLTLEDYLNFVRVCKSWKDTPPSSAFCSMGKPLIMVYGLEDWSALLFDHNNNNYFTKISFPEILHFTCITSRKGLLLGQHDKAPYILAFFNPFASSGWIPNYKREEDIFLMPSKRWMIMPLLPSNYCYSKYSCITATFTAPPTSPDCVVSVASIQDPHRVLVATWRHGCRDWTTMILNVTPPLNNFNIMLLSRTDDVSFGLELLEEGRSLYYYFAKTRTVSKFQEAEPQWEHFDPSLSYLKRITPKWFSVEGDSPIFAFCRTQSISSANYSSVKPQAHVFSYAPHDHNSNASAKLKSVRSFYKVAIVEPRISPLFLRGKEC